MSKKSMYEFRKVGGRKYKAWKEWGEGEYIIGKVVSFYDDNYDHTCPELSVIETNMEDINSGDNFGVNYTGAVAFKLKEAEVAEGDVVRLEYLGTEIMQKGKFKGKEFHNVEVSVAENTDAKSETIDASDDDL